MVKTIHWISHAKKNRSGKNGDKDGKAFYKLIKNIFMKNNRKLEKQHWYKTRKQQKKPI